MDSIISYFSEMPTLHRSIVLFGGLFLFLMIENFIPFFQIQYNKWKHTGLNLFFTLTTVVINLGMAFILVKTTSLVETYNIGVLNWVAMPSLLSMIIGLLLMDLIGAWFAHFIEHKVKWMWQFHVIHHTDKNVDASTANRHHPGESVIRFIFTCIAIFIVGAPVWLIFLYQSMSVTLSQFNHSNIYLPKWLDSGLMLVFCTPNMHRVHHHYRQPYSDCNYGNIFSFWDRIFGTFEVVDNSKLIYGVDTYMEEKEANHIGELLKIPFNGYRETIEYDKEEQLN